MTVPLLLAAALAADPTFRAESADSGPATGPLAALGRDWAVRVGPTAIAGDRLVSLRQIDRPRPDLPDRPQLVLANGDRLAGLATAIKDEAVTFRPAAGPPVAAVSFPLDAIGVIWLEAPDLPLAAAGKRSSDEVYLKNGDVLKGTVVGLADELAVQADDGKPPVTVPAGRVKAIALNPELARKSAARGPYARAVLADGSRLSLASAELAGGLLSLRTLAGPVLAVPPGQLVALDVVGGRAVYLADLKPTKAETEPYFGPYLGLSATPDAARTPRLAGGVADHAVAMHSRGRVTYKLAGKYRRFEATAGLADRSAGVGRVRLRVLADGKPVASALPADRDLTAADGPVAVRADVTGAAELTLEADYGRRGPLAHDERNHVVWADARLVR